ncbi:MAG: peptidylprolyl isomerase [Lachnospiraceae bacterium]|nr:peptidylprolyl isomerase [Lachnospiraceae bacterium]
MKNPIATFTMSSGAKIVCELLYSDAPNTVSSFLSLAALGCYDNYNIQRIVPGSWIDVSYSALGRKEACYFLKNEAHDQNIPIKKGLLCMGGYHEDDIAGGEIFFPLRDCPDLTGRYPALGRVLSGMEELERLEKVETYPVVIPSMPSVKINTPVKAETILTVTIDTFGQNFPEPIKKKAEPLPEKWA